jgi:hypothetical protein
MACSRVSFTIVILPANRDFRLIQLRIKQFLLYGGRKLSFRPSRLYELAAVSSLVSTLLCISSSPSEGLVRSFNHLNPLRTQRN